MSTVNEINFLLCPAAASPRGAWRFFFFFLSLCGKYSVELFLTSAAVGEAPGGGGGQRGAAVRAARRGQSEAGGRSADAQRRGGGRDPQVSVAPSARGCEEAAAPLGVRGAGGCRSAAPPPVRSQRLASGGEGQVPPPWRAGCRCLAGSER